MHVREHSRSGKGVSSLHAGRLTRALPVRLCGGRYVNAGTVEFLVDPKTWKHYFIEVNPRIQARPHRGTLCFFCARSVIAPHGCMARGPPSGSLAGVVAELAMPTH